MKITAVNPPFLKNYSRGQRSPAVTKSGTLYYPIWLAYATGALENAGHELDLIDAPADSLSPDDVRARIDRFDPSMVVVETSTPSIGSDVAFADSICTGDRTVVLVGTHVSALPEETLDMGTSFSGIVKGEYEIPLIALADTLQRGDDPAGVPGLYLRGGEGAHVCTGPAGLLEDLDSLPFVSSVYSRFLNVRNYSNPNALYPQVMVMGGRGCPHGCTFCVFPQTLQGRGFRCRSTRNIVDEMLWIQENLPEVRAVFFEDDTISVDRERLRRLAGTMIDSGVAISWSSNMRANVDRVTLELCAEAGLRQVCVGFESGSDRMLQHMHKGITTKDSRRFIGDATSAGILVHGCFMVGTPGETAETMRQTLDLALEMDLHTAQFYPMMVYPGTEAYRQACDAGNITVDGWRRWLTADGLHSCVVRTEELTSDELVDFCDMARRKFYLRPSYILHKLWRSLLDPDERRRLLRAFGTFRKYLFRSSRASSRD